MDISADIAFVSFSNGDKDKVSVCAKDLHSGEVMMTYTGGACAHGTLNLIGSQYLMGADEHRPIIYLWALNKKDPIKRIKAVGKIGCLAVSSSSSVCVGSVDERMYVWMVHTGNMTRSISYHCTRISCITFSTSSLDFASCDKHGSVALWSAPRIMSSDSKSILPLMTFVGHSAKVTDAHLNETYLVTCALDKTVRVWHLRTGEQYKCFDFEGAITSVSMNPTLRYLLVGWNEARLSVVDLDVESRKQDTTFVVNSDVVCMAWTTEGAMLFGDERGTIGLLRPDMIYIDEVFTHPATITNIVLAPFLPHGWNDSLKPSIFDIVPLSEKLCEIPDHLGAPVNFHQVKLTQTSGSQIYSQSELISECIGGSEVIINDRNDDKNNHGSSAKADDIKERFSHVLRSLLLK